MGLQTEVLDGMQAPPQQSRRVGALQVENRVVVNFCIRKFEFHTYHFLSLDSAFHMCQANQVDHSWQKDWQRQMLNMTPAELAISAVRPVALRMTAICSLLHALPQQRGCQALLACQFRHALMFSSSVLHCLFLQIRFQRYGRRKLPFYRIVAIDSRSRRQGEPCEVILSPGSCFVYTRQSLLILCRFYILVKLSVAPIQCWAVSGADSSDDGSTSSLLKCPLPL